MIPSNTRGGLYKIIKCSKMVCALIENGSQYFVSSRHLCFLIILSPDFNYLSPDFNYLSQCQIFFILAMSCDHQRNIFNIADYFPYLQSEDPVKNEVLQVRSYYRTINTAPPISNFSLMIERQGDCPPENNLGISQGFDY